MLCYSVIISILERYVHRYGGWERFTQAIQDRVLTKMYGTLYSAVRMYMVFSGTGSTY